MRKIERTIKQPHLRRRGDAVALPALEFKIDKQANARYLALSRKTIKKTVIVSDYCNVDIDKEGKVVGIELLYL